MPLTKADLIGALSKQAMASSDFDLNPALPGIPPQKDAGVLVPFVPMNGDVHVVLTKRSAHLKAHPGQIAFPGGRRDAGDVDITATALREAQEETGLPPAMVQVLGTLPPHDTVTAYAVTPVVAWVQDIWDFAPNPGEVDTVFTVPAHHVLTLQNFKIQGRRWRGAHRHYYTVPYGPYYIWGATARMLYGLASRF
ncbi:MAG: CoA pyrophosphatase [Pseudomonadota bacterium]